MNDFLVLREDEEPYDFGAIAEAVYKKLGQTDKLSVELNFVSPEEIRRLNNDYRGVDRVTDVLSFPYLDKIKGRVITRDDFKDDVDEETDSVLIGSVCICLERAKEQAEEYGHSEKREINYLLVHGILHLFGYDHMTDEDKAQMRDLEEKIMNRLNLTRDI